jgi:hypothetical protein
LNPKNHLIAAIAVRLLETDTDGAADVSQVVVGAVLVQTVRFQVINARREVEFILQALLQEAVRRDHGRKALVIHTGNGWDRCQSAGRGNSGKVASAWHTWNDSLHVECGEALEEDRGNVLSWL